MTINKSTIQAQIISGKTEKAIEMLLELGEKFDKDIHTSAIMLSARYKSLAKDKMMGVISESTSDLTKNRINHALTSTLDEVQDSWQIGVTAKIDAAKASEVVDTATKTILFLAANPRGTERLRLDKEVREIDEGIRRSTNRDSLKLVQKWAVRIPDLRRALLDEKPSIIHFSGHGSSSGRILFEDESGRAKEVSPKGIGELFSLFSDRIECVFLNACYSESQAQEIAKHIPYVIGMNNAVPDKAAIEFSTAFYDAIASGEGFDFAFKMAQVSIKLSGLRGADMPVLLKK